MSILLDFSSDSITQVTATLKTSVVNDVDTLVQDQKALQPTIAAKINRSSVMSILIAEALEARSND